MSITGIVDYCKRYSEGAVKVQDQTFKQIPVLYDVPTAEKIQAEYNQTMPLDKIQDKRRWRDDRLAALAKLKQQMGKND
jgi:L-gulonate 3-dehydrogenase